MWFIVTLFITLVLLLFFYYSCVDYFSALVSRILIWVPPSVCHSSHSILLSKKIRRLPVVDAEGKLEGLLSRRDIVKAALEVRKAAV